MTAVVPDLCWILEDLLAKHGGTDDVRKVDLRSLAHPFADARLIFGARDWLNGEGGKQFLQELENHSAIASVKRKQGTVSLRLDDAWLVEYGHALSANQVRSPELPAADQRFIVGFAGPNTSKALHLGHLRNVVVGHGLAAAMQAAGGMVVRHSLLGDVGRNAAESMAGFTALEEAEAKLAQSEKGDHFIGRCYRSYLQNHDTSHLSGAGHDPNHRESVNHNDAADAMLQRLAAEETEAVALWRRLRDLVMAGHAETLAKLGIDFDRFDYESAHVAAALELQDQGIAEGLLTRGADGVVSYLSERSEFECMVLRRSDGFPTEHGRLLSVYEHLLNDLPDWIYLDLAGDEWQPASALHTEILANLRPGAQRQRHEQIYHGMVSLGESVLRSSQGDPELIDTFLEALEQQPVFVDAAADPVARATFLDQVIKGYLLSFPTRKKLPLDVDVFTDESRAGWTVAKAWLAVQEPARAGMAIDPEHPGDRLLLCRAHEFGQRLNRVVELRETDGLASYVTGICKDHLEHGLTEGARAVAQQIFPRLIHSVGMQTSAAPSSQPVHRADHAATKPKTSGVAPHNATPRDNLSIAGES